MCAFVGEKWKEESVGSAGGNLGEDGEQVRVAFVDGDSGDGAAKILEGGSESTAIERICISSPGATSTAPTGPASNVSVPQEIQASASIESRLRREISLKPDLWNIEIL